MSEKETLKQNSYQRQRGKYFIMVEELIYQEDNTTRHMYALNKRASTHLKEKTGRTKGRYRHLYNQSWRF